MGVDFIEAEKRLRKIISNSTFTFNGKKYKAGKVYKPQKQGPGGETKTDAYFIAKNLDDNTKEEFKISYKKESYSFIENKLTEKNAPSLYGKNWSNIINKHNLIHLAVIERHGKNNDIAYGFIKDFNLKSGAVGSSVGHDAHNIIIAGTNERDMNEVLKEINKTQGCIVIIDKLKIIAKVNLPIAGLLSDKRAKIVALETKNFKKHWKNYRCSIPYMGFNLLPLSVIPEFRLTNKGLIDVNNMKIIPLFEK